MSQLSTVQTHLIEDADDRAVPRIGMHQELEVSSAAKKVIFEFFQTFFSKVFYFGTSNRTSTILKLSLQVVKLDGTGYTLLSMSEDFTSSDHRAIIENFVTKGSNSVLHARDGSALNFSGRY